jgi:hypothetical protein
MFSLLPQMPAHLLSSLWSVHSNYSLFTLTLLTWNIQLGVYNECVIKVGINEDSVEKLIRTRHALPLVKTRQNICNSGLQDTVHQTVKRRHNAEGSTILSQLTASDFYTVMWKEP